MSAAKPPGRDREVRVGSACKGAARKAPAWKEATEPDDEQVGSPDNEARVEGDTFDQAEFAYASAKELLAQW